MAAFEALGHRLRGWWGDYYGGSVTGPSRLGFNLPPQQRRGRRPTVSVGALQRRWQDLASQPDSLVADLADYLATLNRYPVAVRRRALLLDAALRAAVPIVADTHLRYRDEDGFPESAERRQRLNGATEVVRQLATGYKLVFRHDFVFPELTHTRARLALGGHRILELIRTEQRLLAQRYQKLPAQAWRDCNQVYAVMLERGCNEQAQAVAGCLRHQLRVSGAEVSEREAAQHLSPRLLYISIQLLGLADTLVWPSRRLHVLDSYLRAVESRIEILSDPGGEVPAGSVCTDRTHAGPPTFQRLREPPGDALLLNLTPLLKQLNEDHAALFSLNEQDALKRISAPLSVLDGAERRLFVELLRGRLCPRRRREERVAVNAYRDLRLYCGFMESFRLAQAGKAQKPAAPKTSLHALLCGKSAPMADSAEHCAYGDWFVVNESPGGILLRTRETRYSTALAIGQLVTYDDISTGARAPQVGYIGRLHRASGDQIEVTVIKLAGYAESVAVQDEALRLTGRALPAILMRSLQGRWQLILHNKQRLEGGSSISLRRGEQVLPTVLGSAALLHPQFTVYEVEAAAFPPGP